MPEAVVSTLIAAGHGSFDFGTSLRTGEIVFKTGNILDLPNTPVAAGVTFGRAIIYVDTPQSAYSKDRILAHELVHRFQYNEYQVFNSWLQPVAKKIRSKALQTIFSKYIYADIPYFFLPYYIDGHHAAPHYYRNFFEFEADRFATNSFVPR